MGLSLAAVSGADSRVAVASPVAEQWLWGAQASLAARGLSSYGSQTLELRLSSCGTWA